VPEGYETCLQCGDLYNTLKNYKDACDWHSGTFAVYLLCILTLLILAPGELEPDMDSGFWDDHDEEVHGEIEDLTEEMPDGFEWSCCERSGDEEGCEQGRHESDVNAWKSARMA
jgi:hypothetical protein